jgi:hypothetical protein
VGPAPLDAIAGQFTKWSDMLGTTTAASPRSRATPPSRLLIAGGHLSPSHYHQQQIGIIGGNLVADCLWRGLALGCQVGHGRITLGCGTLVYSGPIAAVQPAVARISDAAKRTAQRDLVDLLIFVLPCREPPIDLAH